MVNGIQHILTGEFPPQPGGVSDYTAQLAEGLVGLNNEVHIWTKQSDREETCNRRVAVHRFAQHWSHTDLQKLDHALNGFPAPRRLWVQYTPNAWGQRGLNFGFCRFLMRRHQQHDDVRLMIHEPFYPWRLWDKPTRWLLAAGQRRMMRILLAASSAIYLSIPGWESMLRPYETREKKAMTWLPIPSNIPIVSNFKKVAELRRKMSLEDRHVIGSFSTFGAPIKILTRKLLLPLLLSSPKRVGMILGRGGENFVAEVIAKHPQLKNQLIAPGALSAERVSFHLQVCDLLIQPYPDGVSSRRSTMMAGLSHGKPIVTTKGFLTEAIWEQISGVVMINTKDATGFILTVENLLKDTSARHKMGAESLTAYRKYFALENTLSKLLS